MKDPRKINEKITETSMMDEAKLHCMLDSKTEETEKILDFLFNLIVEIRIDIENLKEGNHWNGHSWVT